jgi:mycothiol synthase
MRVTSHRPYRDHADIEAMTRVLEAGLAATPNSAFMHPGDLRWRAFKAHGFPLSELIELWEDDGRIVGFGFLEAASEFSAQVEPELRGSALEQEVLAWCHAGVLQWRAENDLEPHCEIEVFADDSVRGEMLESMGYRRTGAGFVAFKRTLAQIPAPRVPEGFEVRGLQDRDIDSRATCQFEAFTPGSTTTPETWRALMANAPGYVTDLDSVVVAPDGTVVAAALAWLDRSNAIGLYEPVATRPTHQRQGCGKAALLRGLHTMRAYGMTTAFVGTNATNLAARALYASVGFDDRNHGFEYGWRP